MHIIVKESERKIDPRHPESAPNYKHKRDVALNHYPSMKFENEAQRRDYLAAVKANRNNLPGIPAFYPPEHIQSFIGTVEEFQDNRKVYERMRDEKIVRVYLKCDNCVSVRGHRTEGLSSHIVKVDDCYCQVCGKHKLYRI